MSEPRQHRQHGQHGQQGGEREVGPTSSGAGASDPRLALTHGEIEATAQALSRMDFGTDGVTRDGIRAAFPALPKAVYLRLPSSKHFINALEVLQEAELAPSRAEGEFLGANPDLHEAEVIEEGGPPLWGPTPLFTPGGVVHGGSMEDTEGLEEGE